MTTLVCANRLFNQVAMRIVPYHTSYSTRIYEGADKCLLERNYIVRIESLYFGIEREEKDSSAHLIFQVTFACSALMWALKSSDLRGSLPLRMISLSVYHSICRF